MPPTDCLSPCRATKARLIQANEQKAGRLFKHQGPRTSASCCTRVFLTPPGSPKIVNLLWCLFEDQPEQRGVRPILRTSQRAVARSSASRCRFARWPTGWPVPGASPSRRRCLPGNSPEYVGSGLAPNGGPDDEFSFAAHAQANSVKTPD